MIELPSLLLTPDVGRTFKICAQLEDSDEPVVCDAARLTVAEPMALCALVATLSRMQRVGRHVQVLGLTREFKRQLESLDILSHFLKVADSRGDDAYQGALHAYRVKTESEGNDAANRIAKSIAALVPPSASALSAHDLPLPNHSIVVPLAYIFTELIDNGLQHGRGRGYSHANVWLSAQYHPPGALLRLAVADDGCGFLSTFQGRTSLRVNSHADAIRTDIRPFTSCKRDVGLFADAQHQGLGLTICRDLALRSEGQIAVVSGNSWIINPGSPGEESRATSFWQGAVIGVELRLPTLNALNFFEITRKYKPNPDLPIRFM